jgi:hypothetical protein
VEGNITGVAVTRRHYARDSAKDTYYDGDGGLAMWGDVAIWDTATYEFQSAVDLDGASALAFGGDLKLFVGNKDGSVHCLQGREARRLCDPCGSPVLSINCSGDRLIVLHGDGNVRVLSGDAGRELDVGPERDAAISAGISGNGHRLAFG